MVSLVLRFGEEVMARLLSSSAAAGYHRNPARYALQQLDPLWDELALPP